MDINLTGIFTIAVLAAAVFGLVGFLTARAWWAWAIWGGFSGLVIITVTVGLAHAAAVPYAGPALSKAYMVGSIWGLVIIFLIAGLSYFSARNQKMV